MEFEENVKMFYLESNFAEKANFVNSENYLTLKTML